jgi:tetratricopeptide (TPR) repeat protein
MCYKGSTKSLPEIAQELNVDTVLEGSVLLIGQRVRITVQLISAATDTHLWAEDYDRDLQDVLLLQSEVAQAVAQKIHVTVTEEDAKRLQSVRKINPEAYENYLKARYHLFKGSPENLEAASGYLRVAMEKDPKFAGAYSAMADLQLQRSMRGYVPPSETISKAKEAIQMALQIDDSQPEVHISLGIFKFGFEWDWDGALEEYQKAIQLNGNIAEVHFFYADCLISLKRDPERWKEEIDRALTLDPLNSFIQCMYGWNLIYLGKYDEAIAQLNKALLIEPNFSSAHLGLWGAFYKKQMPEQALNEAIKFYTIIDDHEIVDALKSGESSDYQQVMNRAAEILSERSAHVHVPAIRVARLYAHAGAREQTLQWLEKAFQHREMPLFHLNVGWDWDEVRDDPRFQNLLRQMKLI